MGIVYTKTFVQKKQGKWQHNFCMLRLTNYAMRVSGCYHDEQYEAKKFYKEIIRPLLPICERELNFNIFHSPYSRTQFKTLMWQKEILPHTTSVYLLAILKVILQNPPLSPVMYEIIEKIRQNIINYSDVCLPQIASNRYFIAHVEDDVMPLYLDLVNLIDFFEVLDERVIEAVNQN